MRRALLKTTTAIGLVIAAPAMVAHGQQITVWAGDTGTGGKIFAEMAEKFEAENPGVDVVVEEVSYQTLVESLPVQLEAGEGPDIAIITDLGGLSRFYQDITQYVDAAYFEQEWSQTLQWLRPTPRSRWPSSRPRPASRWPRQPVPNLPWKWTAQATVSPVWRSVMALSWSMRPESR